MDFSGLDAFGRVDICRRELLAGLDLAGAAYCVG
jgi:hypothetical protein